MTMIKQTIFTAKWAFDNDTLEIYETPFCTFYVRNNITHYVIMPGNASVANRIRVALDKGYTPFSMDWCSDKFGAIGSCEFDLLELGELYE